MVIFHSYVSLPEGSLHQVGICHPSTNAEAPVRLHPRPGAPQPPGAAWRPEIEAGVIPHGSSGRLQNMAIDVTMGVRWGYQVPIHIVY